jgi:hypothetical protein
LKQFEPILLNLLAIKNYCFSKKNLLKTSHFEVFLSNGKLRSQAQANSERSPQEHGL